mmetsp:Transcript_92954/g.201021  ORF Transcript_92954/g.201021 Transcript_92954/m.201021 type:complete len:238 (-) Transcript_92954:162-875(-)
MVLIIMQHFSGLSLLDPHEPVRTPREYVLRVGGEYGLDVLVFLVDNAAHGTELLLREGVDHHNLLFLRIRLGGHQHQVLSIHALTDLSHVLHVFHLHLTLWPSLLILQVLEIDVAHSILLFVHLRQCKNISREVESCCARFRNFFDNSGQRLLFQVPQGHGVVSSTGYEVVFLWVHRNAVDLFIMEFKLGEVSVILKREQPNRTIRFAFARRYQDCVVIMGKRCMHTTLLFTKESIF